MSWQMSNGRFVDATSSIDIDSVYHFKRGFETVCLVLNLILAGRRKKKTAIWGEC